MKPFEFLSEKTKFISSINESIIDDLFTGIEELFFISFVVSLQELLRLSEKYNLKHIVGIIGKNITDDFKKELTEKNEIFNTITDKIKNKQWELYILKKEQTIIHDKFYLLKNQQVTKIVTGSANLTQTGLSVVRQKNTLQVYDFPLNANQLFTPNNEKTIDLFMEYFNDRKKNCELFMEDLLIQYANSENENLGINNQITKIWLCSENPQKNENEGTALFIKKLTDKVLEQKINNTNEIITLDTPTNNKIISKIKNIFPNCLSEDMMSMRFSNNEWGENFYKKTIQHPIMFIKNKKIYIYFKENISCMTESQMNKLDINDSLQNIEDFCNTINLGTSNNPKKDKTCFYEAILYFLNAPFVHELMKIKKQTTGTSDGIRYLVINGKGSNGKSELIKYCFKLLCTKNIDNAYKPSDTTPSKIQQLCSNTLFPIVTDDLIYTKIKNREEIYKNYWEKDWITEIPKPQIIDSTNYGEITELEWAKRRIKRIDFNTNFIRIQENAEKLNKIRNQENNIFKYFSYYFLNKISLKDEFKIEDELKIARIIMKELYLFAERKIPIFFPEKPLEEIYDNNAEFCYKLLKNNKHKIIYLNGCVQISFNKLEQEDLKKFYHAIPKIFNPELIGNIIKTDNKSTQWIGLKKNNLFKNFLNPFFSLR